MRRVGQVLLAVILVVGLAAAGGPPVGATQGAPADGAQDWQWLSAMDLPDETDDGPLSVADDPAHVESTHEREMTATRQAQAGVVATDGGDSDDSLEDGVASAKQQPAAQVDAPASDRVVLTQEFRRLPEVPGSVGVNHGFTVPDRVVSLRTAIPARANVTTLDGFDRSNETIYEWDGRTEAPSISYTLDVNETGSRASVAANGSLLFADTGDWALFRRPATSSSWEYRGREDLDSERRSRTVGPGATGEWLVYLGDVAVHQRTVDNQTFRLVTPAAATLEERPERILNGLERAATDLEVDGRAETIFAVAAPTDGVPWAVRGITAGQTDFWVGADESLATPENVWIHEYVHTRQYYRAANETRWTREAFPTYYAAVQAMKHQPVTFEEFADSLARGNNDSAGVTLSEPATWASGSQYDRGALVAGQIDRRIRTASGGERSLHTIMAAMNTDADRVNETEFFQAIEQALNGSSAESIRSAVTSDRPVPMWNQSQHVAAFGGMPARFEYALPPLADEHAYRVVGPYRNQTLHDRDPLTVVPGESVVVDAGVENVGGSVGYYDVGLRVGGEVVDTATGPLAPDRVQGVALSHTFERAGEYTIGVGDDARTISVREPARATLVDLAVQPSGVTQYETATVSATVRNDAPIPGERTIRLTRGTVEVVDRSIRLGPNTTRTAEIDVQFPVAGTTTVMAADGRSVTVEVAPAEGPPPTRTGHASPSNATTQQPVVAEGTGFSPVAALLAILVSILTLRSVRGRD